MALTFGLGPAWHRGEHDLYGGEFPDVDGRHERLDDALQLLPLMRGTGAPRFEGRTVTVPEAICYPRPLQDPPPILVGGSGERRTLRLVARYAQGCNLFGDADTIHHKAAVVHENCASVGRDPAEVQVTHLSEAAVLDGDACSGEDHATVDDHIGRYRQLAEAGVQHAFVAVHVDGTPAQLEAFAPVVAAFGEATA